VDERPEDPELGSAELEVLAPEPNLPPRLVVEHGLPIQIVRLSPRRRLGRAVRLASWALRRPKSEE